MVVTDHSLWLIFEYLPFDLKRYLQKQEDDGNLNEIARRKIFAQVIKGITYLHKKRIIHRDLKPQNILVDMAGNIKLADFGLARQYSLPIKKYTHEVVTVWYRAPEIILGCTEYNTSVDAWSLGCIFGEIYSGKPMFPGDSEIGGLFQIFQILGTPTEETWKGVTQLKDYQPTFPKWKPMNLATLFPSMDADALDLLKKFLEYDPLKRISAKDALNHPYFKNIPH